ncbi:MAG: SIS domain-containing protein [Azospirillum sp.]|nr:SIS domain-containing protein [Azospirillum sp.]
MSRSLETYLESTRDLLSATIRHGVGDRTEQAIGQIVAALSQRRPLLVCGNGGSAADALHIAGELVGRFLLERPALPVIALSANAAVLTAWSNDYDYESVFARQVEAHAQPGGVVWGISTSGNSPNVVAALQAGRRLGMGTLALTGDGGGRMAAHADVLIDVPSRATPRIQEMHICLYHFICAEVERRLVEAAA